MNQLPYHHAALGGTFDRFHKGHQALLRKAFDNAEKVTIGVTTQSMSEQKQLASLIASYDARVQDIQKFLNTEGLLLRSIIIPLTDVYGPTITDETIDLLVVSSKTVEGAKAINQRRKNARLAELVVEVAEYITASDGGELSSSRIRVGQVDREGFCYEQFLLPQAPFVPPVQVRAQLQEPLGTLLAGSESALDVAIAKARAYVEQATLSVGVGDIIAKSFFASHLYPHLVLIDNQNKRAPVEQFPIPNSEYQITVTKNKPGKIERQAIERLGDVVRLLNKEGIKQLVSVQGEEDLLVLPLILLLPLGSVIFYGQAGQGIVVVKVTEEEKSNTVALLKKCIM